jgi:ketosteroid isomerase-like protein
MSEKIQLIQDAYAAMAGRDVTAILALFHDDFSMTQTPLLPWGRKYFGKEGLGEFFKALLSNVENSLKIEEYFEADNRVIVIGRTQGKVLKNKAPFDVRFVHVWQIADGKIVRFEPYIDTPRMLESLHS